MRRILISLFLAAALGPVGLACSCASYEPRRACEVYPKAGVVFRGRVIDDNDPNDGRFGTMKLYRFQVIEAFKGISPETREVFIDPSSLTSCSTSYARDKEYLIYASAPFSTLGRVIATKGAIGNAASMNAIPAHWNRLGSAPVVLDGGCSPTRTIEPNDSDLSYLRQMSRPLAPTTVTIFGLAIQAYSWPAYWREFPVLPGAGVTVRGAGKTWSAETDRDGRVEFTNLPPGDYFVEASKPGFPAGKLVGQKPEVSLTPGECANLAFNFESGSTISGTVRYADGSPANDITVDLARLESGGKLKIVPHLTARSRPDGGFTLKEVPAGPVVVGVNLDRAPDRFTPFEPTFAPGVQNAGAARVFDLRPGQQVEALNLKLPPSLKLGTLMVEVVWPNGRPVTAGVRATADWNGKQAGFDRANDGSNTVALLLPLGRSYEISANQFLSSSRGYPTSAPVTVLFEKDKQAVVVRLRPTGSR